MRGRSARVAALLVITFVAAAPAPARAAEGDLRWGLIRVDSPVPPDSIGWDGRFGVEGRAVSEAPLEPAILAALGRYARAGYPFATALPGPFDEVNGRVEGTVRVDPGARSRLDGLVLDGARVTRPATAERLAGIVRGRPYTGAEKKRVRERLLRSGLFRSVGDPTLDPGSVPGAVALRVPVSEPPYTRVRGVLGVSGKEARLTGLLDLELDNIAGTAREARARWESRGGGLTRYELGYREPWLPLVPVGFFGALRHDVNEGLYSYTTYEVGGDLDVAGTWRFRLGLGGTRAIETAAGGLDTREGYVMAAVAVDGRDSIYQPTSGGRVEVESRRGTKTFRDGEAEPDRRVDRTRWRLDAEGYRRLGPRWVAALASTFLFLDTPEDSLPRYDLFAVGGATSLRGYREEQFLAAAAWIVQVELRLLQDDRGSSIYAFCDTGLLSTGVAAAERDRFDRVLLGYGIGVRQAARVGILGIEYAAAKGENPLDGRLHLRLDAAF